MKLQFNPNLDFQQEAIRSIVDIFEGQPITHSNFTVANLSGQIGIHETNIGVGNKLDPSFDEEDILKNVRKIQLRNGLPQTENIEKDDYHFTVEMETGTGKTYVYLRTLFELNQKYGFKKFIIVVPSVAIKEGVVKSINIMSDHFKLLYDNVMFRAYEYQSQNIERIRDFATSDHIQIMVMTIQSFNKDKNVINNDHERTNGLKPIEFIRDTNPIVVIDEPQSTVSTKKAEDAVMSLNPLCTLRYSATHRKKHNLMYKLDAVDAYQRQLVKQIEVASVTSKDYHNDAYLRLVSVDNSKTPITAKIEIDKRTKNGGIKRQSVQVKKGDDLFEKSGGREQYSGYIVSEIYAKEGSEYVDFTSRKHIELGEVRGELDDEVIKRTQIRKTIEEHLEKELRLKQEGIKILSLFFIDRVSNYRYYDEEGNPQKGKYAIWFEEEYKDIIQKPKYRTLFNDVDIETEAEAVHNGYFSKDRKGKVKDTRGNTQADEDTYNLIMKDKERLLDFNSKLKFIFSHSALKEGWDNPNVFQICTLNETKSEIKKRQEIGRGLRLAVDQNGERRHGFNINTLTVMANESYEDFAKALQKEIEEEEGIKFGVVEKHTFANLKVEREGEYQYLEQNASEELWNDLKSKEYIDDQGKITDKLKEDIKNKNFEVPEEYKEVEDQVVATLKKIAGSLRINNADDKKEIKLNKQRYLSPEFKELWDRIKYKTTYNVEFDTEELIQECVEEIKKNLMIDKAKVIYTKGEVDISAAGTVAEEKGRYAMVVDDAKFRLPDIITYLQNETSLTRKTIVRILKESGKLYQFKNNPQKFMDEVSKIIKTKMRHLIVDGIKYEKIGEEAYYAQELFENEELFGYLSKNLVKSEKSVYDHVICDSDVEADFAQKFENNDLVKVYAKLPDWFKIDTPLGDYNPDWAVLIDKDGEERLYFVVETKGSVLFEELRPREEGKIKCGEKHFEALGNHIEFEKKDNFEEFIENV
ncbi:type III restriction-modification system endonuclease [Natranaerobius thermophilus]|uniref:Type III restriction protein res subunit n=1 Tax=Natranaerobius thermophilus (strain ATCC BAA-1301 / DSM 18059 / JW/NM-WN-LF) TaxID=457570 RepID=B2A5C8_NATTJ|nr:DEAD/DEAH box helicase family protein [Natranaerobius thermophilus]ACB83962.1 type III restriction protein res subunit [Natranaerobius thermophilus JW/NM-WN-LF]